MQHKRLDLYLTKDNLRVMFMIRKGEDAMTYAVFSKRLALSVSVLTLVVATDASAQDSEVAETAAANEEIVVTGTRSRIPLNLESVPGSVTVLGAEEIAAQAKFGNDLGEILQRTVP